MADNYHIAIRFLPVKIKVRKGGQKIRVQLPTPADCVRVVGLGIHERLGTGPFAVNIRFYGIGPPGQNSEAFVKSLLREYMAEVADIFTLDTGVGEKMYYVQAKRLGVPSFEYGDVRGGFLSPRTVTVTDEITGITEDYYLFESTEDNLGETTVDVIQR